MCPPLAQVMEEMGGTGGARGGGQWSPGCHRARCSQVEHLASAWASTTSLRVSAALVWGAGLPAVITLVKNQPLSPCCEKPVGFALNISCLFSSGCKGVLQHRGHLTEQMFSACLSRGFGGDLSLRHRGQAGTRCSGQPSLKWPLFSPWDAAAEASRPRGLGLLLLPRHQLLWRGQRLDPAHRPRYLFPRGAKPHREDPLLPGGSSPSCPQPASLSPRAPGPARAGDPRGESPKYEFAMDAAV